MPRFAANLSMLFTEHPFLERFDRARAAGFECVEFQFPYAEDIPGIAAALQRTGQELRLFNMPPGDFAAGERGLANNPARRQEFRDGVARALEIAARLNCGRLNCMAGVKLPDVPLDVQFQTQVENMRYAAEAAEQASVRLVTEPLNYFDAPNFSITTTSEALYLFQQVGHPNLKIQYDVYHMQRMEGNLVDTIRRHSDQIGHVQIADSPDRHEPGTGEINFPYVFRALDEVGYDGWVSLEYKPSTTTEASLAWLRTWGYWQ